MGRLNVAAATLIRPQSINVKRQTDTGAFALENHRGQFTKTNQPKPSRMMKHRFTVLLAAAAFAAHVAADSITFRGVCDGSAAVKIPGNVILVGYDELNALFAFDVNGGPPLARADLVGLLGLERDGEMDLEAAASAGDRIWWVGSHGLNKRGGVEPNRRMLFATNVPTKRLEDVELLGGPWDLTEVLLQSPEVTKHLTPEVRKRPPKKGGVNLEGLAATDDGGLLAGFRSPLSEGKSGNALIVELAPKGASFEVRKVHQLDLDDRGVREITRDRDAYVIVAGPVDSRKRAALYRWDGTAVHLRSELKGFNAESVVDAGNHWLVLSDNGKDKRADEEADDGDRSCDKIRRKNSRGENHPNVFFEARKIAK